MESIVALAGVVLGGLIAAATNAFFAWRAERDRRLGAAFSVFFKYFFMVDVTNRICRGLGPTLKALLKDKRFHLGMGAEPRASPNAEAPAS